jgi:hypothetical protein
MGIVGAGTVDTLTTAAGVTVAPALTTTIPTAAGALTDTARTMLPADRTGVPTEATVETAATARVLLVETTGACTEVVVVTTVTAIVTLPSVMTDGAGTEAFVATLDGDAVEPV